MVLVSTILIAIIYSSIDSTIISSRRIITGFDRRFVTILFTQRSVDINCARTIAIQIVAISRNFSIAAQSILNRFGPNLMGDSCV